MIFEIKERIIPKKGELKFKDSWCILPKSYANKIYWLEHVELVYEYQQQEEWETTGDYEVLHTKPWGYLTKITPYKEKK